MLHLRPNTKTYSSKTPATGSTPGSTPNTNILEERLRVGHRQSPHFSNFSQLDTLSFPANFSLLRLLKDLLLLYHFFELYFRNSIYVIMRAAPTVLGSCSSLRSNVGSPEDSTPGRSGAPATAASPEDSRPQYNLLRRTFARRN